MEEKYIKQVSLLVKCLPIIASEKCFAIKGGTAINLFKCDLPRLSVDIDLVYLPIEDRETTHLKIHKALSRISDKLNKLGLSVHSYAKAEEKLVCSDGISEIKIEPNYTKRGFIYEPKVMELCSKAQDLFGYAQMRIISDGELWGGKICAALDRQHPRDLFDIHNLMNTTGMTAEIKNGFIAFLMSSNRPLHEMLAPHFQLKEDIFYHEFVGMTDENFTFEEAKQTFDDLVQAVNQALTDDDKELLLNFVELKADLANSSIPNLDKLPSIKWKMQNLTALQTKNQQKFMEQSVKLREVFFKA